MKGEPKELKLIINGKPYELMVKPKTLLVELLRNELRLIGTKQGCLSSSCGVCTVSFNSLGSPFIKYLLRKSFGFCSF